jgi:hypothetical protein
VLCVVWLYEAGDHDSKQHVWFLKNWIFFFSSVAFKAYSSLRSSSLRPINALTLLTILTQTAPSSPAKL